MENSSKEYNKSQVKELILGHNNWEFVYIGANIDSYSEASTIGIKVIEYLIIQNLKRYRYVIF